MNVGQIKQKVKKQFGDEAQVQISDTDIVGWINDAQRHIISRNENIHQKVEVFDLVQGQQEYNLPGDCFMLRSVTIKYYDTYMHLRSLSLTQFDEYMDGWDGNTTGTGRPLVYVNFANTIRMYPYPDIQVDGGLKIYYNRYPTNVANNSDLPDVPPQYYNAVVQYVMQQAYELDEDMESSQIKAAQVQTELLSNRYVEDVSANETYPTITTTKEDMWYS